MSDSDLPADVLEEIRAGRKIEAIKLLREHDNELDLTEAKRIVDKYAVKHGIKSESQSGCASMILLLGLAIWFCSTTI